MAAEDKVGQSMIMVQQCKGMSGMWAAPDRYPEQCWTRDFALAILPYLLEVSENEIARRHILNLARRQRENGQIPILFLDHTVPFIFDRTVRSLKQRQLSFMLKRWLQGQLWNLTPGTRDSEIMFLLAVGEYTVRSGDASLSYMLREQCARALEYVETTLMRDGLHIGCDWRDTMHETLGDKALLTNNAILHRVYTLSDYHEKAKSLRYRIHEHFFSGGMWHDYEGSSRPDPLGLSLAILYDAIEPHHLSKTDLLAHLQQVDTQYGVTIKCKHNPLNNEEARVIEETQGVVVWPFVSYFTVLALIKRGLLKEALALFRKTESLQGLSEWYDPRTGKPYGAIRQLWSAVLYMRARDALLKVLSHT